jgi:hypothetical protein
MEKAQRIGLKHRQSNSVGPPDYVPQDTSLEAAAPRELEKAWETAKLRRDLRSSGGWSIVWGILTIIVALFPPQHSDFEAVSILMGLLLIGAGVTAWRSPKRGTLLADASALLLVGGWNIAITLLTTNTLASFRPILGLVQTILATPRFARYPRFVRAGHAAEPLIANTERLVTSIQETQQTNPGNLIEFQAEGKYWKGQLSPGMVTLVAGNARQVRFLSPDVFALTSQDGGEPRERVKVSITVEGDTWTGKTSYESMQQYKNWKAAQTKSAGGIEDTKPSLEARHAEAKQHLEQAHAYEQANDLENALSESEHALRLAPDWAEAYDLHRLILGRLGKQAEAIAAQKSGPSSSQTSH